MLTARTLAVWVSPAVSVVSVQGFSDTVMRFVSSPSIHICQDVSSPFFVQASVAEALEEAVQANSVGAGIDERVVKETEAQFDVSLLPMVCTCT